MYLIYALDFVIARPEGPKQSHTLMRLLRSLSEESAIVARNDDALEGIKENA